jgi:hypothetical protein
VLVNGYTKTLSMAYFTNQEDDIKEYIYQDLEVLRKPKTNQNREILQWNLSHQNF